jgi:S1-C subfamily serine protease
VRGLSTRRLILLATVANLGIAAVVVGCIVSARGRDIGAGPYDDFIQIDAPVNKGNSGGPTFDMDGNVIGSIPRSSRPRADRSASPSIFRPRP